MAQADLQKAYQRVSHETFIVDLHAMNVPGWLLRIMVSYLSGRNMTLKFRGAESERHFLPSSSPQGTFLGIFIFIVVFSGAFLRPKIPRPAVCSKCVRYSKENNCVHESSSVFTAKYIDDSSRARAVSLVHDLIANKDKTLPRNFRDRTGHMLDPRKNLLQEDFDEFREFCKHKNQKVNHKKSTLMIFNFSRKLDFSPKLNIDNKSVNIVSKSKILGLTISDSLKWNDHIDDIVDRVRGRLFVIQKLMKNGIDYAYLIDVFHKEIRSVLEYGAVIFHFGLTKELSNMIEDIQKIFMRLLSNYIGVKFSYMESCIYFYVEPLILRRESLCRAFIRKILKNESQTLFTKRSVNKNLNHRVYKEYTSYHQRHFSSPLVALTRLANQL